MNQPVAGAHEVHEGAEIDDFHDLAGIDHTNFRFGHDAFDPLDCPLAGILVDGRDLDGAVVFDIDLGAGDLANLANDLAAGADDLTNFVARDLEGGDARRVGRDILAAGGQGLGHLVQDVQTAFLGLGQGDFHDLLGDRGDLDVHLQRRDALIRSGDLEVHVAEMILVAKDVGKNCVIAVILDQPHGDAGHRADQGHARIHQRQ